MGGSDQWGNIVHGVELGRRVAQKSLYGLTTPLMATASGAKMGKSIGGAVWLNAERLSPYEYWQYWRDCEDADIGRFLKLFTELPLDEIARLEKLRDGEINEAKKVLATEATALCHGRAAASGAATTSQAVFGTMTFSNVSQSSDTGGGGLPQIAVAPDALAHGVPAFELFVQAGLAASNGEARRLIKGGGARLNDAVIASETQSVSLGDLDAAGQLKLSAGRKRHVLVRLG